jgi:sugar lactone lactonase YvrE
MNPLDGFLVDPATLGFVGEGLQRPECILAERDGTLWVADGRGGVTRIGADGAQDLILQGAANTASGFHDRLVAAEGSLPNGLCLDADGSLLVANWGTERLERMSRDGRTMRVTSLLIPRKGGPPHPPERRPFPRADGRSRHGPAKARFRSVAWSPP